MTKFTDGDRLTVLALLKTLTKTLNDFNVLPPDVDIPIVGYDLITDSIESDDPRRCGINFDYLDSDKEYVWDYAALDDIMWVRSDLHFGKHQNPMISFVMTRNWCMISVDPKFFAVPRKFSFLLGLDQRLDKWEMTLSVFLNAVSYIVQNKVTFE